VKIEKMAANVPLTRSLALVGAKLTTGPQNIRRLAARAAPHRHRPAGEAHESNKSLRRDIFLPAIVKKNLGAYDVCLDRSENLLCSARLPNRRLSPHKPRALLFRHKLSAYQDDFSAQSRTIVARQFVGLTNADAVIEIATWSRI
jgi:hypothetical protein